MYENFQNLTHTNIIPVHAAPWEKTKHLSQSLSPSTLCITWDKQNLEVLRNVPLRVAVYIALCLLGISETWAAYQAPWLNECWALGLLFTRNFSGSNESLPYRSLLAEWPVPLLFLYDVGCFELVQTSRTVFLRSDFLWIIFFCLTSRECMQPYFDLRPFLKQFLTGFSNVFGTCEHPFSLGKTCSMNTNFRSRL